jgi:hypothetical protein
VSLPILLAFVAGIALVAVGAGALLKPGGLSQSYGLPVDPGNGLQFVRACGARDIVLGLILIANAYLRDVPHLIVVVGAGLVLSLADFAIAFAGGGGRLHRQHVTHVGGAVAFAVILVLLLASLHS